MDGPDFDFRLDWMDGPDCEVSVQFLYVWKVLAFGWMDQILSLRLMSCKCGHVNLYVISGIS
jgi:hypothetical protein